MRILGHLMNRSVLAFLMIFVLIKAIKIGTNVGLNISQNINVSARYDHIRDEFLTNIFTWFPKFVLQ